MKHELLKTENGYDFWKLTSGRGVWWNITPEGRETKPGGFVGKEYIENVKGQKFDA